MYRNQKIILLHSEEEDKLPESLELGELAVNCHKDKEFICLKNTDNQIIKITPNGGGGGNSNSNKKQPFKLEQGINNAIVSEGNHSNKAFTFTHGLNMHNDSELSFAFGYNKTQISPILINGKHLKLIRDTTQPECEGYYDGAIIVDEEGNHISDLVSYSFENNGNILDIEVSKEFDFRDGPKFMLIKSNEGGSCNFNFGTNNHLSGSNLCAFGKANYASGANNYVVGNSNIGNGICNVIFGINNHVFGNSNIGNGICNVIFGINNHTEGSYSILQGNKNKANGSYNVIIGYNNDINGNNGIYAGQYLEGNGQISSAFGIANDVSNSYLFTVGNGRQDNDGRFVRHNALSINDLGEVLIQEDVVKEDNGNIKYPPMISLQSLVTRIKTLEEELKKLKNK